MEKKKQKYQLLIYHNDGGKLNSVNAYGWTEFIRATFWKRAFEQGP